MAVKCHLACQPSSKLGFRLLELTNASFRFLFPGSSVDYRLDFTSFGVLLCCTFDGTVTVSNISNCTHSQSTGCF